MSRIYISPVIHIVIQTPVVPVLTPELLKVVDIRTLDMKDFSKDSLLRHIESCKFEEVIYTVLKLHTMFSCPLRSLN